MVQYGIYPCPLGILVIGHTQQSIVSVKLPAETKLQHCPSPLSDLAAAQLMEYFAGCRQSFDLPLCPEGTPFQLAVWQAIKQIPYGQTLTYGQIAAVLGKPGASRAVGQAANRNSLWILIPCHRVIGKDHRLTGYAGGIAVKQVLLELERDNV